MSANEPVRHRIRAYLYENPLTRDKKTDYIARIVSDRSLSVHQLCKMACDRGGSDIKLAAMEHAVDLFLSEMEYNLYDGFSVNLKSFSASPRIRGVFDSPDEQFNPDKHSLVFDFQQGDGMRRERERMNVEILGPAPVGPHIWMVIDMYTGSVNELLTPSRSLVIRGGSIKIAGTEPGVGVRFLSQSDPEVACPVDPRDIVNNYPAELMVVVPELAPGAYKLEITTQFMNKRNRFLKEPRTVVFDKVLHTADAL
ncbi:MAG: DUF4469 domain-containing protein [Tannerellaceae bacterium]|jgi:hypothetical protein|nr:DUF4469 domain-containing protein [Tannerellaceae bacterium]